MTAIKAGNYKAFVAKGKTMTLKLCLSGLENKEVWLEKEYKLPTYDIQKVIKNTTQNPKWLHFGAGNIFRVFPAVLQQKLLNEGKADTGIIMCESFDEEIIDRSCLPFDNLAIAVTLKKDGGCEKEVVASITESIKPSIDYARLVDVFCAPTLQMISMTITEKGYAIKDNTGEYYPWVKAGIENYGVEQASLVGMIAKLLYMRYTSNAAPVTLVSMDNCSHNGTLLKEAIIEFAEAWEKLGFVSKEFLAYLNDESKIYFTWSMIDKITPRPSEIIEEVLRKDGVENITPVKTEKNSYVAPFVNAEESQYLAIEDKFTNGRDRLEDAGVLFADRETIDKIEKMKVCTCLNPLHTVLAVYGCLLGYDTISDEMGDSDLVKFIEQVGYVEGLPVVVNPGILSAKDFIDEVVKVRLPNPFVPDTPQRIATDTSKKIPVRFGETLKAYIERGEKDLSFLTFIPLQFAGWLRYLLGVDDAGNVMEISPDPNLDGLRKQLSGISIGADESSISKIKPLLSNSEYFGIDLYEYNLGEKVEGLFLELCADKGAIRKTLKKYLSNI